MLDALYSVLFFSISAILSESLSLGYKFTKNILKQKEKSTKKQPSLCDGCYD
jgi:hypothetical protein